MRYGARRRRAVILLVEDDHGDQELTRRSLEEDLGRTDLRVANDGEEALDYLFRRGPYAAPGAAPRPDVVMLDLNMPRVDGKQVLAVMRETPELCRIPVIVLTTSGAANDVRRAYELGCNSFMQKPVEVDLFIDALRELRHYWLELVTLPPKPEFQYSHDPSDVR